MRIMGIGLAIGLGLATSAWAQGQPAAGQPAAEPPPAAGQARHGAEQAALTPAEMRALLEAARETAKATRESVDYARVVPDLLSQILAKLDKLEDKLDRIETAMKAQNRRR